MRLKKLIAMFLAMTMCLSLASSVYAESSVAGSTTDIAWYGDGCFYVERTPEWNLCIAAERNRAAEFAVSYSDNPGIVYQVYIPHDSDGMQGVKFASTQYWENLKEEGFSRDRSTLRAIDAQSSIRVGARPTIMGAVDDLKGELEDIYGAEYANRTIHTSYDYSPYSAKVTEYLEFYVEFVTTIEWGEALSIAALLVALGCPAGWGALIGLVLDAVDVYQIFAAGTSVDHYRCVAMFTRYGCINNIALSWATRSDVYDGFEQGGETAMESYSERETIYSPHQYTYMTYSVLLDEAYDLYRAIYG